MRSRLDLHEKLIGILGSDHVYFQPPPTAKMQYPCIIYKKNVMDAVYANNKKYGKSQNYTITAVYKNPDSDLSERLFSSFDFCSPNTPTYVADNLYHDVFTIYW